MTIDSEKILIGMWLKGQHLDDMNLIRPETMADKQLYKLIREGNTLLDIAEKTDRLPELVEMMREENSNDYLYEPALDRILTNQMYHAINEMKEPAEILKAVEASKRTKPTEIEPCKNAGIMVAKEMAKRENQHNPKWKRLNALNDKTNGIKRKELTSLAARPSVGKSAIALQIALGVVEQGFTVCYFPLEMSAQQCYMRMMCQADFLTSDEMKTGKPRDQVTYQHGIDWLEKLQGFNVYEGINSIEDITAIIERDKPYLVIIDQLSQMRAAKQFGTIREQFSYMTSNLKAMALKEDVAILLLCQINRSADNTEPTMANLKESGSIEEDSDNIILLHQEEEDEDNRKRLIQIHLAKQRDGATGKFKAVFYPNRFSFYEN